MGRRRGSAIPDVGRGQHQPVMPPVLIGSRAALHGGFLPAWREGLVRDTDVVCDADRLARYCEAFGHSFPALDPWPRGILPPDTGAPGGLNWVVSADIHALILELCTETIQPDWSPPPVVVATKEVVWTTRMFTVGLNPRLSGMPSGTTGSKLKSPPTTTGSRTCAAGLACNCSRQVSLKSNVLRYRS